MARATRWCRPLAVVVLLLLLAFAWPATASHALLFDDDLPRETKVRNLNLLAAGTILAWGVANWDYFQNEPRADSEGWFGHGSDEGGADKLGHLYTTYALSHLFAAIYRDWEYPEERALQLGTLSSLGAMTFMELGDAFSDYGFSHEDFLMNCAGAAVGYWLGSRPELQSKLDLRVEYLPRHDFQADVVTDYENHKYLVALKGEGFDALRDTPLGYLELHLGYYARGYDDYRPASGDDGRSRTAYVGVGLNVGRLIEGVWDTRLFDYLQVPYTYIPFERDLD